MTRRRSIPNALLAVAGAPLALARRLRRFVPTLLCCLMAWGLNGAQPASKHGPPRGKPWIDLKNLCMISLGGGELPTTPEQLHQALIRGWSHTLTLPDPQNAIFIDGDKTDALRTLRIDLSNGKMDPDRKSVLGAPVNRAVSEVAIEHFDMIGQPLYCGTARMTMTLSADNVRMDLEHDRKGHPIMLLNAVDKGNLRFDASFDELNKLILAMARKAASPYHVYVKVARFDLTTDAAGRSLTAKLRLETTFCYVPAGMSFSAHVQIDDAMNAQLSNLKCDGDQVLGPIVVGLLQPFLAKYDGKTRPLISFPSPNIHLSAVSVTADKAVHLTATFSSK